jgi:predicted nucleotidyltransferase component of viral defense system
MNPAIRTMLERYKPVTGNDYEHALKEIIQEIALLGLWRAKFFQHAAFYGGTALRILYGLDRFSEDLDFSLLKTQRNFGLEPYLNAIESELNGMGFSVTVSRRSKTVTTAVESAFIKAGTKEHLLKIQVPDPIVDRAHIDASMNIKVELDTDPPGGFDTEARTLLQPIPFSVNTFTQPDLFAGKLHAILQRSWKSRVKGRDYYDFVWYIARDVPVHLSHLEQRLRQSGGWTGKKAFQHVDLLKLLEKKFAEVNIEAARKDVQPFLRDTEAVAVWTPGFFNSLLPRLKTKQQE